MLPVESAVDPTVLREIQEDEHLLWWGCPDPRRSGSRNGTRALEWSVWLPACAAPALVLLAIAFYFFPPGLFKGPRFIALLLVVAAMAILTSLPKKFRRYRAALRARQKLGRTIYAVTDQRVLVLTRARQQGVSSFSFMKEDISHIMRFERPDGWGDLVFGPPHPAQQGNAQHAPPPPRLVGIPDVRQVEWLMLKTFKGV